MAPVNRVVCMGILLFILMPVQGQQINFSRDYARGRIIDDSTGKSIPFVHIYNESQRRGYISNEEGIFRIPVSKGDTLVLSSLGYLGKVVFISDSYILSVFTINLIPRVYEIDEVTVKAFKSYEDFKDQFLSLKLPETDVTRLRDNLRLIAGQEATSAASQKKESDIYNSRTNTELVTVGIPILSREDKQRMNYVEVLKKEERQRVIEKKYNRGIIYQVTQLSEDEITEFMGFCNFSENYLYKASPYDILVKIEEKFREFKKMKESGRMLIEEDGTTEYLG